MIYIAHRQHSGEGQGRVGRRWIGVGKAGEMGDICNRVNNKKFKKISKNLIVSYPWSHTQKAPQMILM